MRIIPYLNSVNTPTWTLIIFIASKHMMEIKPYVTNLPIFFSSHTSNFRPLKAQKKQPKQVVGLAWGRWYRKKLISWIRSEKNHCDGFSFVFFFYMIYFYTYIMYTHTFFEFSIFQIYTEFKVRKIQGLDSVKRGNGSLSALWLLISLYCLHCHFMIYCIP